jgi:hypothetical protein
MPEKWERQEGETSRNYHIFSLYRDMGITRSLKKVVAQLDKPSRYIGHLSNLSTQYKWVDRVEAYDAYLDEERRKANLDGIRKMNEENILLAQMMRKLPTVKLKALMTKLKAAVESDDPSLLEEAAKEIPTYLVPQLAEAAYNLERRARGVNDKMEMEATVTHKASAEEVKEKLKAKLMGGKSDSSGPEETQPQGA